MYLYKRYQCTRIPSKIKIEYNKGRNREEVETGGFTEKVDGLLNDE